MQALADPKGPPCIFGNTTMMSTGKSRECLALRGSLWLRAKRVKDKEILGFGDLLLWGELLSTERMWAFPELNPQNTTSLGR